MIYMSNQNWMLGTFINIYSSDLCYMCKRSREQILIEILKMCIVGASKTQIVRRANLNNRTATPYIEISINRGLLEASNSRFAIYRTSEKGKQFLERFKIIQQLI